MENEKTFKAMRYSILSDILRMGIKFINPAQLKTLNHWLEDVDRNPTAALEILNFIKGYVEKTNQDLQEIERRERENLW